MLTTVKSYLSSSDFKTPFLLFVIWKIVLFLFLVLAFITIPLKSNNFLGGGYQHYNQYPSIFPWLNYDGEHYLSISMTGYHSLEQAFFPAFPLLIALFLYFLPNNALNAALVGLAISNLAFLISLFLLFKITKDLFSEKVAIGSLIALLSFPTSFFLQAFYTESLFLLSILLTFYFYSKDRFLMSGLFGIVASSTRIFGVILLPSLLLEVFFKKKRLNKILPLFLIPLGLIGYMFYLWITIGDPIGFYHQQAIFGEHRQAGITLYPQTLFRSIRIAFASGFPIHEKLIYIQELLVGMIFLALPVVAFMKKLPVSFIAFSFLGFLLPTTVGSFSSLPRYVLVLFPSFIALYLLVAKLPKILQALIMLLSLSLLCFNTMLFVRGYWVG